MALPNPYERLADQLLAHRRLALRVDANNPLFGTRAPMEQASLFTDLLMRTRKNTWEHYTHSTFADLLTTLDGVVEDSPYEAGKKDARDLLQMARAWWDEQAFNENTFAVHISKALRARMEKIIADKNKMQEWFFLNLLYIEVVKGDVGRSANGLISALYDVLEEQTEGFSMLRQEDEGARRDFIEARQFFEREIQVWRDQIRNQTVAN